MEYIIIITAIFVLLIIFFFLVKLKFDNTIMNIESKIDDLNTKNNTDMRFLQENIYSMINNSSVLKNELENIKQDNYITKQETLYLIKDQQKNIENNITNVFSFIQAQYAIMDRKQSDIRDTFEKSIDDIKSTLGESLDNNISRRLSENFSNINERLEFVNKSIIEMQSLGDGISDLQKTLTNVKTRGIWGELQLQMLLDQVLTSAQYETNVQIGNLKDNRVEFALILPNVDEKVYLPIDSKFPKESYDRLLNSYDKDESELVMAKKEFLNAIKVEAKRISTKYIKPPYTTDFAIMFLPTEGLYAECARHADLIEELQSKYHIVFSGPTTMMALLNSLQIGFKSIIIENRSHEIRNMLSNIKSDFTEFYTAINNTQQRLSQAQDAIDSVFVKTRKIKKHLDDVENA